MLASPFLFERDFVWRKGKTSYPFDPSRVFFPRGDISSHEGESPHRSTWDPFDVSPHSAKRTGEASMVPDEIDGTKVVHEA